MGDGVMRAYVVDGPGGEPRLATTDRASAGENEVLIRVCRSSVNPFDLLAAAGQVPAAVAPYRYPAILGRDVCGEVAEVGGGVRQYQLGQLVFGFVKRDYIGDGTFAEYVAVLEDDHIVPLPAGIEPTAAGCLGLAAVTALACLNALDMRPGSTLLINGATGGVGSMAVQLAAAAGVNVVATARPGHEEELMTELGAASTVDWSRVRIGDQFQAARRRADGVIDLISPDAETFSRLVVSTVRPGGAAVTTRGVARPEMTPGYRTENVFSQPSRELLTAIASYAEAGVLRAPVTQMFLFEEIHQAFAAVEAGATGKIALLIAD